MLWGCESCGTDRTGRRERPGQVRVQRTSDLEWTSHETACSWPGRWAQLISGHSSIDKTSHPWLIPQRSRAQHSGQQQVPLRLPQYFACAPCTHTAAASGQARTSRAAAAHHPTYTA